MSREPRACALAELATSQHVSPPGGNCWSLAGRAAASATSSRTAVCSACTRGVFAVGHRRLTTRARWLAAVLSGGPKAVLSHRAAAALWELRGAPAKIDVTVVARGRCDRPPVHVHCVRGLAAEDVTVLDGIPVTTPPRTLLDLAEVLSPQWLRHLVEAAERRELFDLRALEATITRNPGRRGTRPLRTIVAASTSAPWTQSELERAFLALIRRHGLPEPKCNVLVAGELVDCFWPQGPLVVELDGHEFHRTRRKFEDDRRRDVNLQLAGVPVLRFTQQRVTREADAVISEVRRMLARVRPRAAASDR